VHVTVVTPTGKALPEGGAHVTAWQVPVGAKLSTAVQSPASLVSVMFAGQVKVHGPAPVQEVAIMML
jgi:hypothetical protein